MSACNSVKIFISSVTKIVGYSFFSLLIGASGLFPGNAISAGIYYVDNAGNDNNDGLSPSTAWQHISKINSVIYNSGDAVLLKKGGRWQERLVIPASSWDETRPLYFGAYGEGNNPLLDALVDLVGDENFQWVKSNDISSGTRQAWYLKWSGCNTVHANYASLGAALDEGNGLLRLDNYVAEGVDALSRAEWLKVNLPNKAYSYVSAIPEYGCWTYVLRYDAGDPTSLGVKFYLGSTAPAVTGTFGGVDVTNLIDTNTKNNVVIQNIDTRGAIGGRSGFPPSAIIINGSNNVQIKDAEVSFSKGGVSFIDNGTLYSHNNIVEGLNVHDNAGAGIYLFNGHSYANVIKGNRVHDNYARQGDSAGSGDKLAIGCTGPMDTGYDRLGNQIIGNRVYRNGNWANSTNSLGILDNAISVYSCAGTIVRGNVILNNDQGAFYFTQGSQNSEFVSNIVFGNTTTDQYMTRFQKSTGSKYYNNTVSSNTLSQTKQMPNNNDYVAFFINDGSGSIDFKNNIFTSNRGTSTIAGYSVKLLSAIGDSLSVNFNEYFDNISYNAVNSIDGLFYMNGRPNGNVYQKKIYATLSDWVLGTGFDINSSGADPKLLTNNLADPANTQFDLDPLSPSIDSGVDLGLSTDGQGNPIYGVPDVGAIEYQPPFSMGLHQVDVAGNIRIYGNGKFRNRSPISGMLADFSVSPTPEFSPDEYQQWMDVSISSWSDNSKKWTEYSSSFISNTRHTIGNLIAGAEYRVRVDGVDGINIVGCTSGVCIADANGRINYIYSGSYASPHEFEIISSTPDLVLTGTSPIVTVSGTNLLISDQVSNIGTGNAGSFDVSYYLSGDANYQAGADTLICKRTVTSLAASGTDSKQTTCATPTTPAAGPYYVTAVVDSGSAVNESNETNNNLTSTSQINIGPDLVPTTITATKKGSTVSVSDQVKNQGNRDVTSSFTVTYYLSTNSIYEAGTDIALASNSNGSGTCTSTAASLNAGKVTSPSTVKCYRPEGYEKMAYYVLAVVDSGKVIAESNESNNALATTATISW